MDIQVVDESLGDISMNDVQALSSAIVSEINPKNIQTSSYNSRNASTASDAAMMPASPLILGFNVNIESGSVRDFAKRADISVSTNGVVYRLEEQLLDKIHEVLPKESVRTIVGDAEVLKIFELGDKHKSVVAGMSVQSGSMRTEGNYEFVLLREKEASENDIDDEDDDHLNELDGVKRVAVATAAGTVASLRRFKDNVTSVPSGQECGLIFPGYRGVKVGDRVVCYELSTAVKKITMDENR